jgi:hypothetical protein
MFLRGGGNLNKRRKKRAFVTEDEAKVKSKRVTKNAKGGK